MKNAFLTTLGITSAILLTIIGFAAISALI